MEYSTPVVETDFSTCATRRSVFGQPEVALNGVRGRPVTEGPAVEVAALREAFTTADMRDGTAAFPAERPPAFALPLPRD